MKASHIFALFVFPSVFAKEGDSCTYNGLSGTCQDTSECGTGFTVDDKCPNDPSNVKCCISKSCANEGGDAGACLNRGRSQCSGIFVQGRCPGPSDVQCCISDDSASSDVVIDFWIKAFIPLNVAGVTKSYPKDTSKTMINGIPLIGDCFLTDQREFDSASGAKSRMHSQTWIWIHPDGYDWSQEHHCDETTEVDCEDGDVEGTETQNNDDMSFKELSGTSNKVVLGFKAARNNPLVMGSPNIDLKGTLTVDRVNKLVEFVGMVDEFPAFEAYVAINGGSPSIVAQLGPKPGAGPDSLFGAANRDFQGRVDF